MCALFCASIGRRGHPAILSMPLTSIIIPTHNRPHLLPRAVESALAAGTNVEVIVVDDASTDETANVCATLRGINCVRIERNQRVAGARNVGLLASGGEYISFLDDDDVRLPNSIDEQVKLLEADKQAALIYGQAILGDQSGRPTNEMYPLVCTNGDAFWSLLSNNFIPCGTAVFRRSCIDHLGLLDDSIPGLDDWDLWVRIAEVYPILALEKPVMIWRRSTPISGQGTSEAARIVSHAARKFRRSWMKLPRAADAPAKMRQATWRRFSIPLAAHLLYDSMPALRLGNITRAAKNIFALAHLSPLIVMQLARKRSRLRLLESTVEQAREPSASYPGSTRSLSAP
jgi:Glycosyl transferase family 2